MITVVMPLYNKAVHVRQSVQSVLGQTIRDFRLVVVNDGSTDDGPKIVKALRDPRIQLIDQANAGAAAARNRGILAATTDRVAFLDADDLWLPTYLESIHRLMEKYSHCRVFATNYFVSRADGKRRLPWVRGLPFHQPDGVIGNYFKVASRSDPPLCSSAVTVDREAIRSVGLFPEGVATGEDLLTWAKLAAKYPIAYTVRPQAVFNAPGSVFERSHRFRSFDDRVGSGLIDLLDQVGPAAAADVRDYISLWYKNRTVTFLNLGNTAQALKSLRSMARFSGKNLKWYVYRFLAQLPSPAAQVSARGLQRVGDFRRACGASICQ